MIVGFSDSSNVSEHVCLLHALGNTIFYEPRRASARTQGVPESGPGEGETTRRCAHRYSDCSSQKKFSFPCCSTIRQDEAAVTSEIPL